MTIPRLTLVLSAGLIACAGITYAAPAGHPTDPMPRLDPITRFMPPVEPWVQEGLAYGAAAVDEKGEARCATNHAPASSCDPDGPRPFVHVGFDARAAADGAVRASAIGRVVIASPSTAQVTGSNGGEIGGIVVLEHDLDGDPATDDDRLLTVHEQVAPLLAVGSIVRAGDLIARTSPVPGSHLHFGVRRGAYDPADTLVYRALLPPDGTAGCVPCFGRPQPLPPFPDRWDDPDRLFRAPGNWLAIYENAASQGASDVLPLGNGYVAAGWTAAPGGVPDMWVVRLDREGTIVSQRALGTPSADRIVRMQPTADGGFVALAASESLGPMVLKFDGAGDRPAWQTSYSGSDLLTLRDIRVTSDGGYVLAGTARSLNPPVFSTPAVVKLNAAGAVLWAKAYQPSFVQPRGDARAIVQTPDGGYLVIADYVIGSQGERWLLVLRLDAGGLVQSAWSLAAHLGGNNTGDQIEVTPDGGYIIVGRSNIFRNVRPQYLWLIKLMPDGTPAWQALYGTQVEESGTRVVVTSDGDYVVGGKSVRLAHGDHGEPLLDPGLWIVRLDPAGEILAQRRVPTLDDATILGLRPVIDGGFVLAGGAETGCALCPPAVFGRQNFTVARIGADLDAPAQCSEPSDAERLSLPPAPASIAPIMRDLTVAAAAADLATADTAARRYGCDGGTYGPAPEFGSVSIAGTHRHAVCDYTQIVEDTLCTFGVPGATATAPVLLDIDYQSLELAARVIDAESLPGHSDVVGVKALVNTGTSTFPIPMLDDGSQTIFYEDQRWINPEQCYDDPFSGTCVCVLQRYATISSDEIVSDDVYTRWPTLFHTQASGAAVDCVLDESRLGPLLFFQPGTVLGIILQAQDQRGNVVSTPPVNVTTEAASITCTGDACGCCIALNPDALLCAGLEGMPSPDLPGGICRALGP